MRAASARATRCGTPRSGRPSSWPLTRTRLLAFSSEGLDGQVLAGTLTVREVTRPVSVLAEVTDVSPGSFTARATVRIDRYDFGVTASRGLAGRYLDVTVEVRCVRS